VPQVKPVQLIVALGGILALAAAYGAGRYAAPPRVETSTVASSNATSAAQVQVVERVVAGPVRTVTRVVERVVPCTAGPATPVRETTVVEERGQQVTDTAVSATGRTTEATQVAQSTVTTAEQPRLMLQAGASLGTNLTPAWSAGASYRLTGPLWLGAAYESTGRVELRASITF
jgi:hypothetical protein